MMLGIDFGAIKKRAGRAQEYSEKNNITIFDLFRFAFNRLLHNANKEKENNKKVAYTYNPLPEDKRDKLGKFIKAHFRNKAEFAKEADLDLSTLTLIINSKRRGTAITWKKINDAFEKRGVKLPSGLQIKYEVAD